MQLSEISEKLDKLRDDIDRHLQLLNSSPTPFDPNDSMFGERTIDISINIDLLEPIWVDNVISELKPILTSYHELRKQERGIMRDIQNRANASAPLSDY